MRINMILFPVILDLIRLSLSRSKCYSKAACIKYRSDIVKLSAIIPRTLTVNEMLKFSYFTFISDDMIALFNVLSNKILFIV